MKLRNKLATLAAVVLGALVVDVGAADAGTFRFTDTTITGTVIEGEVEGTLMSDGNVVSVEQLNWWRVKNNRGITLIDEVIGQGDLWDVNFSSISLDGRSNNYRFTQPAEDIWLTFFDYYRNLEYEYHGHDPTKWIQNIIYTSGRNYSSRHYSIFGMDTTTERYTHDWLDSRGGRLPGWHAYEVTDEVQPVPEPSILLGSLLAAAAGAKALKRRGEQ